MPVGGRDLTDSEALRFTVSRLGKAVGWLLTPKSLSLFGTGSVPSVEGGSRSGCRREGVRSGGSGTPSSSARGRGRRRGGGGVWGYVRRRTAREARGQVAGSPRGPASSPTPAAAVSLPRSPAEPRAPLLTPSPGGHSPSARPGATFLQETQNVLTCPIVQRASCAPPCPLDAPTGLRLRGPCPDPSGPRPTALHQVRADTGLGASGEGAATPAPAPARPDPSSARAYRCRPAPWPRSECR